MPAAGTAAGPRTTWRPRRRAPPRASGRARATISGHTSRGPAGPGRRGACRPSPGRRRRCRGPSAPGPTTRASGTATTGRSTARSAGSAASRARGPRECPTSRGPACAPPSRRRSPGESGRLRHVAHPLTLPRRPIVSVASSLSPRRSATPGERRPKGCHGAARAAGRPPPPRRATGRRACQDRRHVVVGGLAGDDQARGDVGVAQTLDQQGQHVELARGEPGRVGPRHRRRPARHAAHAELAQPGRGTPAATARASSSSSSGSAASRSSVVPSSHRARARS